jgi:hypothetical protein
MLTGLRGVGKKVLLNEFEQLADGRGFFYEQIEVSDDGRLAPALVAAFRRILLAMDATRPIGERVRRALGVLKAFSLPLADGAEIHTVPASTNTCVVDYPTSGRPRRRETQYSRANRPVPAQIAHSPWKRHSPCESMSSLSTDQAEMMGSHHRS